MDHESSENGADSREGMHDSSLKIESKSGAINRTKLALEFAKYCWLGGDGHVLSSLGRLRIR